MINFGDEQRRSLGLVDTNGEYTNLALLLSDQCPFSVKAAVFEGTTGRHFLDRHDFGGSLFKQLTQVFEWLELNNKVAAEIVGLVREEVQSYPTEALRESLLNALVHRDYSVSSNTQISLYDDRMIITSYGGLPTGLEVRDLEQQISVARNKELAQIFYRLKFIEAFGTGIPAIMDSYTGTGQKPQIETSPNTFSIMLPNLSFRESALPHVATPTGTSGIPDMSASTVANESVDILTIPEQRVIDLFSETEVFGRSDIETTLGIPARTAMRLLTGLVAKGLLQKVGSGRATQYRLRNS
jgi:ATP-dependent DNA helicase RecG